MGSPPELESLNSMLRIAKIIILVFMILFLLAGLALAVIPFFGVFLAAGPIVFFLIDLVIYLQIGGIQSLVQSGQYARAKEKTFIWMILGIILGGLLPGIFLVLAYVKFDPVINWQRSSGQGAQPGWGAPPGGPAWGQPAPPQQTWGQPQQANWGQPSMGAQPAQSSGWSAPPAAAQPPQPSPPPMAPAAPVATMCPRCSKPATWVAQYNRWYCYSCAQYV